MSDPIKYQIYPQNEPDGEGNGWSDCAEADAIGYAIYEAEDSGQDYWGAVEYFDTRAEAETWVREHGIEVPATYEAEVR